MVDSFYGMHWMLATPFHQNEEVDYDSIPNLVQQAISSGCTGVVGLGVMGESARLTDRERTKIAETIIKSSENLPVTLGTTANGTKAMIDRSKEAEQIGAAAVMVSAPSMPKSNLDALFGYYHQLAEQLTIPIVMQDYPQTSGVEMPVDFIVRVANEIPNVKYLKLEDPPTPTKISAIRNKIQDRMGIFGGLGGVFLLDELRRGSIGAMTGFAYPEILVQICNEYKNGKSEVAEKLFYDYLPLIQFEQQEGIGLAIRKAGIHHRRLISHPTIRHPAGQLAETTYKELLEMIKRVGLK
ncbi:dihydrodipicolinate synthase family protein [Chloroflexi bacterium]|nr:dihydrodipicolinate synthase family protein [Chloroflexota bacterium]